MTGAGGGKNVLVVDDDPGVLGLVNQWLTSAGYAVVGCGSFETARTRLAQAPPDILVSDVRLGAFNGIQLVILAKEQAAETATIVMSAYDDAALRREAAQCGAAFITKPFTREQLLAAIQNADELPPL